MTNYEILKLLNDSKDDINKHEVFIEKLRILSANNNRMMELFAEISGFNQQQSSYLSALQNEISAVVQYMHSFSSRMFFENSMSISNILKALVDALPSSGRPMTMLLYELNCLQDAYDEFKSKHSQAKLMPLIEHANKFIEYLDLFYEYVEMTDAMLTSNEEAAEDAGTFELYMPATLTFEDFVSRLKSIKEIYDELCLLLNVSPSAHPLRIAKVESGSLWASLFGDSKVTALMNDFIRGGANYLKRNYTTEGKLAAIPGTVKTMDEVLGYTKKLKEAGVDVSDTEAELAKGALLIAKNMNNLLARQASVVVSGELITLVEGNDQKALEFRNMPRLENDNGKADGE
ncbi:hypothetical protein [Herbaspirillum sp. SJZ107]|uniref:hypothetical protein n=1 Tax=Herbaspirillum sp. SJZ107 TaxID=2572881 RepID=UPI00116A39C1|nr:hypothetical protein [Herbaspirillum sp. SJZ107]TQK10167.1 hypothetical protein FBX97_0081 [Herbaspirillum sp. SJZ107]